MRLVLKIRTSVELIREGGASRHAEFSDAILDSPLKVSPLDIVRSTSAPTHKVEVVCQSGAHESHDSSDRDRDFHFANIVTLRHIK